MRLVQLMGGRIWVESEAGKGSTFHFVAAFSRAHAPAPEAPGPALPPGLTVLVVDDNETNRRIVQEILSSWGLRATLAESAAQALAALEQASAAGHPIPLLLLVVMDRERWFSVVMGERYQVDARTTERLSERIPFPELAAAALAFGLALDEKNRAPCRALVLAEPLLSVTTTNSVEGGRQDV